MEPSAKPERDGRGIDGKPDTGDTDRLRLLGGGNKGLFRRAHHARRVAQHVDDGMPRIEQAEEIEHEAREIRRAHHGDLGIAADDDRIRVVARVTPAPGHRIAHDHETGDLVDGVVHPHRLEGRAVAAFVPAAVGGRSIEYAINEEERYRPPAAPQPDAGSAGDQHGAEPDGGVADRRPVAALHQRLHLLAGDLGVIPLGSGQAVGHGGLGVTAKKAVVPLRRLHPSYPPLRRHLHAPPCLMHKRYRPCLHPSILP